MELWIIGITFFRISCLQTYTYSFTHTEFKTMIGRFFIFRLLAISFHISTQVFVDEKKDKLEKVLCEYRGEKW